MAKGYRALPMPVRKGTSNVIGNLRSLLTLSNNILQGDFREAGNTAGRFVINTTIGVLGIWGIERYSPHEHFVIKKHYEDSSKEKILKIWLFIIAITIHNMPEGLAVGVGFGGGDMGNAIALAIGIGIQNAPEGLAVAFALLTIGYSRFNAFLIAGATGLFEPELGLIGVSIVTI